MADEKKPLKLQMDNSRVLAFDYETGNWVTIATFPHQTSTKISRESMALKFMRMILDASN